MESGHLETSVQWPTGWQSTSALQASPTMNPLSAHLIRKTMKKIKASWLIPFKQESHRESSLRINEGFQWWMNWMKWQWWDVISQSMSLSLPSNQKTSLIFLRLQLFMKTSWVGLRKSLGSGSLGFLPQRQTDPSLHSTRLQSHMGILRWWTWSLRHLLHPASRLQSSELATQPSRS
jgi:hypothetical protein